MHTGKDLAVKLAEFVDGIGLSAGVFGAEVEGRVYEVTCTMRARQASEPTIKPITGFNSGAHSVTGQV